MPLKPIFLSGRLASLPRRLQEQSASSEDGIESVLSDFDDDTGKLVDLTMIIFMFLIPDSSNINLVYRAYD
jgi:brefeldin A-inhibited guanine nucleotide-exchange protein 3